MEMPLAKSIGLKLQYQGKVRDIYAIDDSNMLIVATDRISAFDVVFDQLIAKKGVILTSVSNFWFDKTSHIIPNHIIKKPLTSILASDKASLIKGRAAIVKKLKPLKIEAIVRGYLIGSGWHDYQKTDLL
jgi:phosphoribosylaminoimidazole-succinocarboxamide synthase